MRWLLQHTPAHILLVIYEGHWKWALDLDEVVRKVVKEDGHWTGRWLDAGAGAVLTHEQRVQGTPTLVERLHSGVHRFDAWEIKVSGGGTTTPKPQ